MNPSAPDGKATYLVCQCEHCAGNIEFPAEGIGQRTTCPHCQRLTILNPEIEALGGRADKSPAMFSTNTLTKIARFSLIIGCVGFFIGALYAYFRPSKGNTREEIATIVELLNNRKQYGDDISFWRAVTNDCQGLTRANALKAQAMVLNLLEENLTSADAFVQIDEDILRDLAASKNIWDPEYQKAFAQLQNDKAKSRMIYSELIKIQQGNDVWQHRHEYSRREWSMYNQSELFLNRILIGLGGFFGGVTLTGSLYVAFGLLAILPLLGSVAARAPSQAWSFFLARVRELFNAMRGK